MAAMRLWPEDSSGACCQQKKRGIPVSESPAQCMPLFASGS
jgi:hypothetical protein